MSEIQLLNQKINKVKQDSGISTKREERKEEEKASGSQLKPQPQRKAHQAEYIPFLKVQEVAQESPADVAGLQVGDQIVKFGPIDY